MQDIIDFKKLKFVIQNIIDSKNTKVAKDDRFQKTKICYAEYYRCQKSKNLLCRILQISKI